MKAVAIILLATFAVCVVIVVVGRKAKRREAEAAEEAAKELGNIRANVGLTSFKVSGLKRKTERLEEARKGSPEIE